MQPEGDQIVLGPGDGAECGWREETGLAGAGSETRSGQNGRMQRRSQVLNQSDIEEGSTIKPWRYCQQNSKGECSRREKS